MQQLQAYSWPGNIRELQNVIERACVLSRGPVVDIGDALVVSDREAPIAVSHEPLVTLEEHERRHIRRALALVNGKIHGPGGAAELLGVNASTLRSRMERLGVTRDG
jgi:DNA-binding NtrC family response regulator